MDMVSLVSSLNSAWLAISPLILNLLVALLLLLIGFLAAKGLGYLTTFILKLIQFDKGSKRIGLSALLEKGELKKTAADLLGDLVYWIIIFVTVISVAKIFGLPIEIALSHVFAYLGLVVLAALVLGIGLFLASLLAGMIKLIALNFGIEGGRTLARVVYYVVVIFTFLAALAQLGIKPEVFVPQIGVIIGAVGLAAAIAFGLGCKDMAADFLHNLFKGK